MRVLVACECSGRVRDSFIRYGDDAWSCDLQPSETPGPHIQGDIIEHLNDGWDLMIAHPPCTDLACSGAAWFNRKGRKRQRDAVLFAQLFMDAPIPRIAVENPVGVLSTWIRRPDQIIQPYWFGDNTSKSTCLWLKNIPRLRPTCVVEPIWRINKRNPKKREPVWKYTTICLPPDERRRERSRTFLGIAEAMAAQWNEQALLLRKKPGFGLAW